MCTVLRIDSYEAFLQHFSAPCPVVFPSKRTQRIALPLTCHSRARGLWKLEELVLGWEPCGTWWGECELANFEVPQGFPGLTL